MKTKISKAQTEVLEEFYRIEEQKAFEGKVNNSSQANETERQLSNNLLLLATALLTANGIVYQKISEPKPWEFWCLGISVFAILCSYIIGILYQYKSIKFYGKWAEINRDNESEFMKRGDLKTTLKIVKENNKSQREVMKFTLLTTQAISVLAGAIAFFMVFI